MLSKNYKLETEITGNKVAITIDPCSWMYDHYGLQITIKMVSGASEITKKNPKLNFKDVEEHHILSLIEDLKLTKCSCGNTVFIKPKPAGKKCLICFLKDIMGIEKSLDKDLAKQHTSMKKKGFIFRVSAWIHPKSGDDYCTDTYFKVKPTKEDINKIMKKSIVKNDYTVYKL